MARRSSKSSFRLAKLFDVGRTVSFRGMAYTIVYLTFVEFVIVYGVVSWIELENFIDGANLVRDTALSIHNRSHGTEQEPLSALQYNIGQQQSFDAPSGATGAGEVEMLLDVLVKGLFGERTELLILSLVPEGPGIGPMCPRINFMLVMPEDQESLRTDNVVDLQLALFPALRLAMYSLFSPGENIVIRSELPESAASDCVYRMDLTMRMDRLSALAINYLSQAWLVAAALLLLNAVLVFVGIRRTIVRPLESIVRRIENVGQNPKPSTQETGSGLYELQKISEAVDELNSRAVTRNMLQRTKRRQLHEIGGLAVTALTFLDGIGGGAKQHVKRCFDEAIRQVAMIIDFASFDAKSLNMRAISASQLVELIESAKEDAAALAILREGGAETVVAWKSGHPKLGHDDDSRRELPVITADPASLSVILRNILKNSVESFRGKGNPRNEILVGLCHASDGERVRIAIQDNGIGIAKDMRSRLFVEGESSKTVDNHGIGLSLAENLVSAHGGTVSVKSRHIDDGYPLEECGTLVEIALPLSTSD
ncbi:MAG: HAMP domain-containing sensor histidine kinase [Rhodobacteraceae bacterium]|nr:HAMP domain-containing sensor histidine kinase [Paracoccaceae bacterium]